MVRLVVSSFQEPETGASRSPTTSRPTAARDICRRSATRWSSAPRAALCLPVRGAAGLGGARAPTCRPRASIRLRCSPPSSCRPTSARSAGSCWPGRTPAGSTRLDGAHRRRDRPRSTSTRWPGSIARHRLLLVSLHLRVHRAPRSTWSRPRWRTPPTSSAPARCARRCGSRCRWSARHPRRPIIVVPRGDRAVRRAGADRHPRALPGRHHAALAVLRVSRAGRGGGRLRDAAAADHRRAVLAAAAACSAARATSRSPARAASGAWSGSAPGAG